MKKNKIMLFYHGGIGWEPDSGPGCQGVTILTTEGNVVIDAGLALGNKWPNPDENLDDYAFNRESERRAVQIIVENKPIMHIKDPRFYGKRPQEIFRSWSRGPWLEPLKKSGIRIDAALATHSHTDHIGAFHFLLPLMSTRAKFWGAPHTIAAWRLGMRDNLKLSPYIFGRDADREIKECLRRARIVSRGYQKIGGFEVWTGLAGHTPGAVYYCIRMPGGEVVCATGDIAWHHQPMVCASKFPEDIPEEFLPDHLILVDFTYPFRREGTYDEDRALLLRRVMAGYREGRPQIVQTYGNAKGPGIASDLSRCGIPLYVDGMIKNIMDICQRYRDWAPEYPLLHTENIVKIREEEHRREVLRDLDRHGGVVVTTSASGEGPARFYQLAGLHKSNWDFHYVGWVPEDSKMARIREAVERQPLDAVVFLKNEEGIESPVKIKAHISRHSLSSHGDIVDTENAIAKLVERRKKIGKGPLRSAFINHCSLEAAKPAIREMLGRYAERVEEVAPTKRLFEI